MTADLADSAEHLVADEPLLPILTGGEAKTTTV